MQSGPEREKERGRERGREREREGRYREVAKGETGKRERGGGRAEGGQEVVERGGTEGVERTGSRGMGNR